MRHSRATRGVYITRPERTIWPVIALVAMMLFSAGAEAAVSLLRSAMEARSATHARGASTVVAQGAVEQADAGAELGRERRSPAGSIKDSPRTAHFARNTQHRALPDVRAPFRRAAVVVLLRSREVADRSFVVRSFRQTVISPRSGGLIRYFPTAPPRGEMRPKNSPDRHTSA